ncbi:MAG: carbohydrate ABC transporter substrate-binding protein [Pseudobutyrivibrio sp.]|nr:carbohydrate ABC transporter substrate-binding protein [Pseudobutyrivibrio sp.]
MKKKLVSLLMVATMAASMVACGQTATEAPATEAPAADAAATEAPAAETPAAEEGKVFNIYAWNEEYKGFFEKYYADKIPADVEVKWTIVPSDNGAYQEALDNALLNQENAAADEKVDMFLAEADYILKYTNSDFTQDITALGVTDFSNTYAYTVEAASDVAGTVKGVSFQCCPSALIYRRSIAKEVLGTDDPTEVQAALSSWDKFDAVAADAKAKGYLMTPSYAETYRVFSNNVSQPWISDANELQFDANINTWMDQAEKYVKEGYTLTEGIWDAGKNAEMGKDGKALCFFGPAWYFNFCMGPAHDEAMGDWAICEGPQAHFWGGTWLLAPTGTDNPTILADCMNTFINDEAVCENLIRNEAQFTNNQAVNAKVASDPEYASEFLGGQNDVAIFAELAKNIKFQNVTLYDQYCNEGLQTYFVEYLKGSVDSRDKALANFYTYIGEKVPGIVTPQ